MDKWEFVPLKSIGSIKFGMDREEVHKLFEETCVTFKKTKFSKNTTDDYKTFHVYYTLNDKVEAVEIFEGIEVLLEDEQIFPSKVSEVVKVFPDIEKESINYTNVDKSVGITIHGDDIECILLGAKGYYE